MILPLLAEERAVGTLSMRSMCSARTSSEQGTLTALATAVGQAVERTRMHEVQHALRTTCSTPCCHPYCPSRPGGEHQQIHVGDQRIELGGDWYDLIRLPEGRLVMVIGDVQGHNTAAAVVMGELRSGVRAYATEGHDPGVVLARRTSC
ncbi:hypothetical protein E4K10_26840 [Streptomyces sp. T1317-0309]|nr:hypothetical protein E4K10_26840 [Streptomyces sp. T1317-0309]